MAAARRVVIVGPPPVQALDITGPLEVFSNAEGYDIVIGTPGPEHTLQTHRRFALTDVAPVSEIRAPIDTLVVTGGPGSRDRCLRSILCDMDRRGGRAITARGVHLHRRIPARSGWIHRRQPSGDTLVIL
jgi:hypothetical protein